MKISRIATSYLRGEWWCAHLADALSSHATVERFLLAEERQPGYPAETEITLLLKDWEPENSLYLGAIGLLFKGTHKLPMPTALWTDFIPHNLDSIASVRLFDQVFATQKDSVDLLRQHGCRNVRWLPFAFDTSLRNEPDLEKIYDVSFVGSLNQPATMVERRELLQALEPICRMNNYRQPVFGTDMVRLYNQSRIVVNIPVEGGFNMRTFEAMAAGALLLTKDVGNGQRDLFTPGSHLVTFHDKQDLLDKVAYYLSHEKERAEIARNGMNEVLSKHTYAHRAGELLQVMESGEWRGGRCKDASNERAALARFYHRIVHRPDLLLHLARESGIPLREKLRLNSVAAGMFLRQILRP